MNLIVERCQQLATISDEPNAVSRLYLSPRYLEGLKLVRSWMETAGMQTHLDAAANLWGSYPCVQPDAPTLILGSHLDTVPNAGIYDGILGVITAIEVISRLNQKGVQLPFHLEVVGIGDEEGVVFTTSMLGSKAIIGAWTEETLAITNTQGHRLTQALAQHGIDATTYPQASRKTDNLLGFWEVHIEQGPVLEAAKQPLGIVTAIAGASRFTCVIEGKAGHAGTVPMSLRQDALCTASEIILHIEAIAKSLDIVATVGKIQATPGAVNVIAGSVTFTLDIRSDADEVRQQAIASIQEQAQQICQHRRCQIIWAKTHEASVAPCHPPFMKLFTQAIATTTGNTAPYLMSGAGHDAMLMINIAPIAMLFVRSKAGISHHPDEYSSPEDIALAADVLEQSILSFAQSITEQE